MESPIDETVDATHWTTNEVEVEEVAAAGRATQHVGAGEYQRLLEQLQAHRALQITAQLPRHVNTCRLVHDHR